MEQEFLRVGYYVNNEYDDEALKEAPPEEVAYDRIVRNVLADKPRVTRIPIKWDTTDEIGPPPPEDPEADREFGEQEGFGGVNKTSASATTFSGIGHSTMDSAMHPMQSMEVEIE